MICLFFLVFQSLAYENTLLDTLVLSIVQDYKEPISYSICPDKAPMIIRTDETNNSSYSRVLSNQ